MKISKYILPLFAISILPALPAKADDSIVNRNITVEREYKPIIQGAGKINQIPKTLEPKVDKITPGYTNFNLPLNADFNIHTLPAAELEREKRTETENGFARIGLGNYFNTLADFAYPLIKTPDMRLDFSLNHLGTFGKKARSTTNANLSFDKYFKSFNLFAGLGGGYEYAKYYGYNFNGPNSKVGLDTLQNTVASTALYKEQNLPAGYRPAKSFSLAGLANDSGSNSFGRFSMYAGVRSLPATTGMRYLAKIGYDAFEARNGLTENQVRIDGCVDSEKGNNRLGMDFRIQNLTYQSSQQPISSYPENYTVFTFNPFYSIERTAYNVRLGVKTSFSFAEGHPFNPSADVHAEWRAVPKYLSFFGGITGGHHVNSMNEMFTANPYLYPDIKVKDTYTPFEFYMGMKIKPFYNMLLDAYVNYQSINDQYFFANKEYKCDTVPSPNTTLYTNRFNVVYSNASHLKIGLRANYNLNDRINIRFKGAYNSWQTDTEAVAWNMPRWEADLNADIRLNPEFTLSGNLFYQGERFAKIGTTAMRMIPKTDINLGLSYLYNDWITLFAKANNLLNKKYQNFYGYDVQGFNVLLGASLSF